MLAAIFSLVSYVSGKSKRDWASILKFTLSQWRLSSQLDNEFMICPPLVCSVSFFINTKKITVQLYYYCSSSKTFCLKLVYFSLQTFHSFLSSVDFQGCWGAITFHVIKDYKQTNSGYIYREPCLRYSLAQTDWGMIQNNMLGHWVQ